MNQRLFVRLDEDAVHGPESNVPAATLRAYAVRSLDMLWREHSGALLDRMIGLPTDQARVDVLQAELVRRLNRGTSGVNRTATHALRRLIDAAGSLSAREVASTIGLGERRLQQLFDTHIGLSPSAWRRLARMHGCLRALRQHPQTEWAELALNAGFYDQSHVANEFQAPCGFTPTEFRRQTISGSSRSCSDAVANRLWVGGVFTGAVVSAAMMCALCGGRV
jgi:AraC-like DNA-binding protein